HGAGGRNQIRREILCTNDLEAIFLKQAYHLDEQTVVATDQGAQDARKAPHRAEITHDRAKIRAAIDAADQHDLATSGLVQSIEQLANLSPPKPYRREAVQFGAGLALNADHQNLAVGPSRGLQHRQRHGSAATDDSNRRIVPGNAP